MVNVRSGQRIMSTRVQLYVHISCSHCITGSLRLQAGFHNLLRSEFPLMIWNTTEQATDQIFKFLKCER